jgi:hypothetical protein
MASAGHAFISHTKGLSPRAQVKDGGYGSPPHPLAVRPGQRYWPRRGGRKVPLLVRRVAGEHAHGVRLDDSAAPVRIPLTRLLSARADGQGRSYQFQGFASRRYTTQAYVCWREEDRVVLCLPEWHPLRPVSIFASLVPADARREGAWLSLRCDLAAPNASRLQLADLTPGGDPGPDLVHRPGVARG